MKRLHPIFTLVIFIKYLYFEGNLACRYINNRQKEPLMRWSKARGDQLPEDINTMPREPPPELNQASLNELAKHP